MKPAVPAALAAYFDKAKPEPSPTRARLRFRSPAWEPAAGQRVGLYELLAAAPADREHVIAQHRVQSAEDTRRARDLQEAIAHSFAESEVACAELQTFLAATVTGDRVANDNDGAWGRARRASSQPALRSLRYRTT